MARAGMLALRLAVSEEEVEGEDCAAVDAGRARRAWMRAGGREQDGTYGGQWHGWALWTLTAEGERHPSAGEVEHMGLRPWRSKTWPATTMQANLRAPRSTSQPKRSLRSRSPDAFRM